VATHTDVPSEHIETAIKLGLVDPWEALLCAPNRYEDYREVIQDFRHITPSAQDTPVVYQARVVANDLGLASIRAFGRDKQPVDFGSDFSKVSWPTLKKIARLEIDLIDAFQNRAIQSIFGSVSVFKDIRAHEQISLRGNAKRFGRHLYFQNSAVVPPHLLGSIKPVYLGLQGKSVNSAQVQALIAWVIEDKTRLRHALDRALTVVREDCGGLSDSEILQVCTPADSTIRHTALADLFTSLHAPVHSVLEGQDALAIAARICSLGQQVRAQRENMRPACAQAPIAPGVDLLARAREHIAHLESQKGYPLTKNQRDVIFEIVSKLQGTTPLNGLLNGEVGAGKTIPYAIAAVTAHLEGARVAIVAPTELLANQIARVISDDFGPGVSIERVLAGKSIKNPDAILVSTPGLNSSANKIDYQPNLLINDEQHKLSTLARESMVGPHTHTLDVSATPIPRTLALSLYKGMDLFTLAEQPVKKDIRTTLIGASDRADATQAIRDALANGRRVAVVYTLVDPQEGTPEASIDAPKKVVRTEQDKLAEEQARHSAVQTAALFEKSFPQKVVLLHGKLTSLEKNAALDRFRSGQAPLMVTTTIFETGIDVPDVSVVIIRDPQHLGLSQLHQLRGRLARNGGTGTCFLLVQDLQALAEDTLERLSKFCETTDGYSLARADMLFRGAGDLDGLQQKGRASTTFKCIKMTTHDLLLTDRVQLDVQFSHQVSQDIPAKPPARQMTAFARVTAPPPAKFPATVLASHTKHPPARAAVAPFASARPRMAFSKN